MIRRHDMPFGTRMNPDGGVGFRFWAPACTEVTLELGAQKPRAVPMLAGEDGWFTVEVPDAAAGDRYGFRLEDGLLVPDPASRCQPDDVHGLSRIVDPAAFDWPDADWRGRPWSEAVVYELHVGSFTSSGSFAGVAERLDHLQSLGVTAIELMPVADWPGRRNWGYDGVLPYAPDTALGGPDGLKALVAAAHARGLMVLLDVVYNHFGPDGNYLGAYAPAFFTDRYDTPWGQAIDFDGPNSRPVRDFAVHNALYWLEEFGLDGLRLDAVHAIFDASTPDILTELAQRVRARFADERLVHLVLENDDNAARYLGRAADGRAPLYTAQWNDDAHHALHVLTTGEEAGYYADYAAEPAKAMGRALAEGFVYQDDPSAYRDGARRGEPSGHLPPIAFVDFLQNHDQIGNRAFGERIDAIAAPDAVEAATVLLLLAPAIPLLFMGQEWGTQRPFPFFCDFHDELATLVRDGRRREFARFPAFRDEAARARIPDPNDAATFRSAVLDWREPAQEPYRGRLALVRTLLDLRRREIVPLLAHLTQGGRYAVLGRTAFAVTWQADDGRRLRVTANLGPDPAPVAAAIVGRTLYRHPEGGEAAPAELPAWSVVWTLEPDGGRA